MSVIVGQIYRHFKGNLYKVICIAKDSETLKDLVIYQALYGNNEIYARPYEMFVSKVDKEKYKDATQEYRFEIWNDATVKSAPIISHSDEKYDEDSFDSFKAPDSDSEDNGLNEEMLEFLDAKNFEDKVRILQGMKGIVNDSMLETMAYSMDVELNAGTTYDKYDELMNCVLLRAKFECNRLR